MEFIYKGNNMQPIIYKLLRIIFIYKGSTTKVLVLYYNENVNK